jgi:hypothetical protein
MDASPSPGLVGALAAKIDGEVHFDDGTHYRHRLRPPSHYSMGWLPLWARIASIAPSTLNAVVHTPPIARVIKRAGGIDPRRELPFFAAAALHRLVPGPPGPGGRRWRRRSRRR